MTVHRPLPVITRFDHTDVATIADEWDRIADTMRHGVFLTWPWVSSWLETLGMEAELAIVAARDPGDGRVLGIAPFFVERATKAGIRYRVLRIVGNGRASPDHLDMIIDPDAPDDVPNALWNAIVRQRDWDLLDLDGVTADGALGVAALRRRQDRDAVEAVVTRSLPLAATWEETSRRFGDGIASNLGRYDRKLRRDADRVEFRLVEDPSELDSTMEALSSMHQQVRSAREQQGAFEDETLRRFQFSVARRMLEAGKLRLWRLDVDSEPIAIIESFLHRDVVSFYTTGYDERWSRYGPGRAVMAQAIRSAIEDGASEFDFLRGDERYKRSWGTVPRHDMRIRRPAGARGRALWLARTVFTRG